MKTLRIVAIIFFYLVLFSFILGIIAPRFFPQIEKPPRNPIWYKMTVIANAIEKYRNNTGKSPDTLDDLLVCPLGLESTWAGPYLKESMLHDPWPFIYEPNKTDPNKFNIICYGADGKQGGEGINADFIMNDGR